jgi:MFS family permease
MHGYGLQKSWYRHLLLVVLVVVYVINIMDRQVLSLLLEDIKAEFVLTDTKLGLLGGIAFAIFYSTMGLPLAAWLDRGQKGKILAACVLVWSLATMACGLAVGFVSLLVARIVTAVGEAGGSPASQALIAEYFTDRRRVTALSIYALAVPIGSSLGNLTSGWINEYYDWRTAFLVVGIPGVVMSLVVYLLIQDKKEPLTSQNLRTAPAADQSITATLRFLWSQKAFVHMCAAAALHSVVYYAGATWNASFLIRSHGASRGEAGTMVASFSLASICGTFLGGYLSGKLSDRFGDPRWLMWLPGCAILLMVPFQFTSYMSPGLTMTLVSFWIMLTLAATFFGPSYAVCHALARGDMRASATAVLLFTQTLIGMGLGPLMVGVISDKLSKRAGVESLAYALVVVGLVNLWSAYHYFLGSRTFRSDVIKVRS